MADLLLINNEEFRKTLSTVDNVFCPHCRSHQTCKEKELVLYLAWFFWVPLKRLSELAKYYKCQSCHKRFPHYGPDWENLEERVAFEFLLLTGLIRVRMANGAFRPNEALAVRQQFLAAASTVVDEQPVMERAMYMKKITKDAGLEEDLIPLAVEKINGEQREQILKAMTEVALKKGKVNQKEAKVVVQVGEILGVEKKKMKEFLPKGYKL